MHRLSHDTHTSLLGARRPASLASSGRHARLAGAAFVASGRTRGSGRKLGALLPLSSGRPCATSWPMPDNAATPCPDLSLELAVMAAGASRVAGVDEVGRGPLAGPVTAAAVILNPGSIPDGIRDSKELTRPQREDLAAEIAACAEVSVAHASVAEIDEINILHASMLAMRRAIEGLSQPPDHVLVDGNRLPDGLAQPATPIVGGDGLSLSIAAASIMAKVARDRIMVDLAQHFPGYGWETNVGYTTKEHVSALKLLGVTPHHRRSFAPVHNILYQE